MVSRLANDLLHPKLEGNSVLNHGIDMGFFPILSGFF
jgi:hypothetical protein